MGILSEPLDYIRGLSLPVGFRVAELGDQWVTCVTPHQLARDWYRAHGCGDYVSIDGNGRGTLRADLNQPLPMCYAPFDLVTDFGTGEHIFDQAQVWRTLHDLCAVGGYLVWDRPSQGYQTHGYYGVDPCLYADLAAANQYRVLIRGQRTTPRGVLERGVWQKTSGDAFRIPQQGRYRASLKV